MPENGDVNGKLLQKIHGKVCAIDERTKGHTSQLDTVHEVIGTLREKTAAQDEAIDNLKDQATRAGKTHGLRWGAGTAGLATVLLEALKHAFGIGTP